MDKQAAPIVAATAPTDRAEIDLLSTMDGSVWAKEFCRITGFHDESWALSWFCNAIMAGWDHGIRRAADSAAAAGHTDAAEVVFPGWSLLQELRSESASPANAGATPSESSKAESAPDPDLEAWKTWNCKGGEIPRPSSGPTKNWNRCEICRMQSNYGYGHWAWHDFCRNEINPIALVQFIERNSHADAADRILRYVVAITGMDLKAVRQALDEPESDPAIVKPADERLPTGSATDPSSSPLLREVTALIGKWREPLGKPWDARYNTAWQQGERAALNQCASELEATLGDTRTATKP